ncbi:Mitochondrial inner membrane translocase subunit Tim17/Tim22/Tim23/peroxisomal protein PMP24 [Penicillium brevicompactum]|uniref:Mitochondrial inner membrane translocase subunit Tim17/Tim22/Tim23/peroxisomal protein PMP24 n=1 Tax=Penicillium brevicompactum TaxID=5074 RepID=A0A9W9QBB7_PENBR|nr:Mitochondrial inner membrane translocase subunit Tim17/Tim22/Tim23/peroxisomal protein PMP24 [Penicillium brevicompactum]KAJ5328913.1 Mitochondrial inner membrane translocase subunit Tim17/Tim22/Tim23/peroxisomal protein PMP24 [Penicillium brevicompactum]KAJ5348088.1 Mitochondrial inner membrane translocase subunit Tim17/Tim22/Tim23/peroxisomal protein PMP24 [Penicillium brevicompactum]
MDTLLVSPSSPRPNTTLTTAVPTRRPSPQARTRALTVTSERRPQWNRLRIESPFSACAGLTNTSSNYRMIFLFRSGTIREKTKLVFKATRQHARNLSTFAIIYKASMILLRNIPGGTGKEGRYDTFFAGLLGGYAVFGRQPGSISQQIVIYVFARVMLALAKIAIQPNMHPLSSLITPETRTKMTDNAYPVFASMTWAMVMYIWRWHPETLASSLRSSMVYIYGDSDHWDSLRTLLLHNK